MTITQTLYHGTDARIVAMPQEERLLYIDNICKVVDYLWGLYKPLFLEKVNKEISLPDGTKGFYPVPVIESYKTLFQEKGRLNTYINLYQKLGMLDAREHGSGFYQYGGLYLTGVEHVAEDYARSSFAGGELGLIAYRLLEGLDVIDIASFAPNKEMLNHINTIKEFSAEGKEDPVVFALDNLELEYLLMENGDTIRENMDLSHAHYRYLKDITFDLSSAKHLKAI